MFTQPSVDFQVVAGEADGLAVHTSSTLEARVVDSWAEEMGTECLYNELQYNKTSIQIGIVAGHYQSLKGIANTDSNE